jgi:cytochrome c-type biogenesis protein CcmH/NrfG
MSREGAFNNPSDLPEMISQLDTAIVLDPAFADPYSLLAFAQARAGDPAKGLASMQKAVSLSPRNENYQFNLAQMYMNNRQTGPAIAILQTLTRSSSSEVAARASASMEQAQQFEAMQKEQQAANAEFERRNEGEAAGNGSMRIDNGSTTQEAVPAVPNRSPPSFLKGTIVGVDCSSPPNATLTVVSSGKTWKMQVSDSKHVLLIGADVFSCSWSKQSVALNYRETGAGAGRVVSIEVQ